jgi:hypothetical protein
MLYSVDVRVIKECGAVSGMRIGRGNINILRKLVPMPIYPQIPLALT